MNKHAVAFSLGLVALLLSGCQSMSGPTLPSGMSAGAFSRMVCAEGRTFAVRVAEGGQSARVRALHGASELLAQPDGSFADDGYKLILRGPEGPSLWHKGKVEAQNCKVQG